jgi:hypothetical protein
MDIGMGGMNAARARVYHQVHGQVRMEQFGNEVCGDGFPPVGAGITDHVVVPTVPNARDLSIVRHRRPFWRASV